MAVSFVVLGFEPADDGSQLAGLVRVALEVAGLPFIIDGFRLLRTRCGPVLMPPVHRGPEGTWRPTLELPQYVMAAMTAEVVAQTSGG